MDRRAPSLDLLRTFQAVYRTGTLTAAARLLHLAQPTVTSQVQALETAIGRPLFVRQARGVTPTPAGDDLARQLDGPLDDLAAVARGLGASPPLRGSTLHLGGPADFTSAVVLPALVDTIAAGVAIRTRLGLAEELLDALAGGELDLVVSTIRPRRRGLAVEPLCDEEFLLVAAPAFMAGIDLELLATKPDRALRGMPLLAYAEDLPVVRRWWRHVTGTAPTGRAALVVPDLRGLLSAALAGAGATVLPRYLCAGALAAGQLVEVLPTEDSPINTLYLAARIVHRNDPPVAHVWSALMQRCPRW